MANIRIYENNLWPVNTLSYSSQSNLWPATNTQKRWFVTPWQSQSSYITNQWLKSYSASKAPWTTLIIFGHNLTVGATLQLQASNDNFATTPIDILVPITMAGTNPDAPCIVYSQASPVAYNYTRILLNDAANPDNHLELGKIYLGTYFDPQWGFSPSSTINPVDPSTLTESEFGQVSTFAITQYEEATFTFEGLAPASAVLMHAHKRTVGTSRAWFFTLYPEEDDPYLRTYYARATGWAFTPIGSRFGGWESLELTLQTER